MGESRKLAAILVGDVYGALGRDCHEPGEDSDAITLIKSMGVHPGYGWKIMSPDADEEDDGDA
jgi:hypothetical protein